MSSGLEKKKRQRCYTRRDEPLPDPQRGLVREPNPLQNGHLHETRYTADPIYRMLLYGNELVQMDDGTRISYMDLLLCNARQLLTKKYGSYYTASPWTTHMWHLFDRYPGIDLCVKVFAFNYIMHCESTIATAMAQLYDVDSSDALFGGKRGPQQLFLYLRYFVAPCMEQQANAPYNKYTCVAEMEQHLQQAIREYVLGPFSVPRLTVAPK